MVHKRLVIKRSEAKSNHGGFLGWLREYHGLRDDVDVTIRDGGMYGNRNIHFDAPEFEEPIVQTGYFSSGISPHYKVTISDDDVADLFDHLGGPDDAS